MIEREKREALANYQGRGQDTRPFAVAPRQLSRGKDNSFPVTLDPTSCRGKGESGNRDNELYLAPKSLALRTKQFGARRTYTWVKPWKPWKPSTPSTPQGVDMFRI